MNIVADMTKLMVTFIRFSAVLINKPFSSIPYFKFLCFPKLFVFSYFLIASHIEFGKDLDKKTTDGTIVK